MGQRCQGSCVCFRSQIWIFSLFSLAICSFTLEHHSDFKQRRFIFLSQRDSVNFASFGRMTQCSATLVLNSLVSLRIFSAKFIDSSVKSIQREAVLSHRGVLVKCSKVVRWCFDVSFVPTCMFDANVRISFRFSTWTRLSIQLQTHDHVVIAWRSLETGMVSYCSCEEWYSSTTPLLRLSWQNVTLWVTVTLAMRCLAVCCHAFRGDGAGD